MAANQLVLCQLNHNHLHFALSCHGPINGSFSKGIKLLVLSAHEIRLKEVATVPIVLKLGLIQLHCQVRGLEIQCDHLAARVPEYLKYE